MTKRHDNRGLRKLCDHPRRQWSKCACAWHFSFKWGETHYRFSLDKHLGKHIDSRSAAEDEAHEIRKQIKAGTFGQATPRADMTLRQLADVYIERYVSVERSATAQTFTGALNSICTTEIPRPTGGREAFGAWRVADIVTDSIERFREVRRQQTGPTGTNRLLEHLRAMFNWAVRVGYIDATPFKRGTEAVVKLSQEHTRVRRLDADEEQTLLAACGPHLYALIVAALETGMRRGEILSLQWSQVVGLTVAADRSVTWAPRAEILIPWAKSKTKTDRRIPISSRLRAVLALRRFDPAGEPHGSDAYVFGTEIGGRVDSVDRAWATAVLKAHGIRATYSKTANLDAACRKELQRIDLHFHDLRREAGSRWLEGGVPLHTIRDWLGHTNIAQTSTYLSGSVLVQHDAMARFEAQRRLQPFATDVGSAGRLGPSADTGCRENTQEIIKSHEPAIM